MKILLGDTQLKLDIASDKLLKSFKTIPSIKAIVSEKQEAIVIYMKMVNI